MEQKSIFRLIHLLEQMNNELIIQFSEKFPYSIGISPILILSELKHRGATKQVYLANALGYTKGAMTNIANKLVQLELAERIYDETDRRTIQLEITNKGLQALVEAQEIGSALYEELFSVFNEDELLQYYALQKKLMNNMKDKKLSFQG